MWSLPSRDLGPSGELRLICKEVQHSLVLSLVQHILIDCQVLAEVVGNQQCTKQRPFFWGIYIPLAGREKDQVMRKADRKNEVLL